jgi:DNA-binding transcriptional LysR family regulator
MKWDDLKYAVAIHRMGSYSGAADLLKVTHTTVSRRIRTLEEYLGVKLFLQTDVGFTPTTVGLELIETALGMEDQLINLERRITNNEVQLRGSLSVSTVDFVYEVFKDQFASFVKANPNLEVSLSTTNTPISLTKLEADVVLRITNNPPDYLFGRKIIDLKYAVYASGALVNQVGMDAPYEDYPWIHHTEQIQSDWMDLWLKKNAPNASISFRVDSAVTARQAVESGVGVHFLPSSYAKLQPNLVRVGSEVGEVSLWFLTHPDLKTNGRVKAFSDFMFKELRVDNLD